MKLLFVCLSIFSLFVGGCKEKPEEPETPTNNNVIFDEYGFEAKGNNVSASLDDVPQRQHEYVVLISGKMDRDGDYTTQVDQSAYTFNILFKYPLLASKPYPVVWDVIDNTGETNRSFCGFAPEGTVSRFDKQYQTTDASNGAITVSGFDEKTLVLEGHFSFTGHTLSTQADQTSVTGSKNFSGDFHVTLRDDTDGKWPG